MVVLVLLLLLVTAVAELVAVGGAGHAYLLHAFLAPALGAKLTPTELVGMVQFAELTVLPAIVIYLFEDLFSGRMTAREWGRVLVASLPAALVGAFLDRLAADRLPEMITAVGFLCTSFVLLLPYLVEGEERSVHQSGGRFFSWWRALAAGGTQVLSVFSGVSRLGMMLGSGALAGLRRRELFRFALLTAIPFVLVRVGMLVALGAAGPGGTGSVALVEFCTAVPTMFITGGGLLCSFAGVVVLRALEWLLFEDKLYATGIYLFLLGAVYTWSLALFLEPPI